MDTFGRLAQSTKLAHSVMAAVPWPVLFPFLCLWANFQVSYTGMAFELLQFRKWHAMYMNFNYCVIIIVLVGIVVCSFMPKQRRKKTEGETPAKD